MKYFARVAFLVCLASPALGQALETRTIELKQLKPGEAVRLLRPYIVNPGGGVFDVSEQLPIITIKDEARNFETLERVLAKYDQPPATIRLVFQLIEADTGPSSTKANARPVSMDLDSTLRSVLRFPSYRLLAQGVATVGEFSRVAQQFANAVGDAGMADGMYQLMAEIGTVRVSGSNPGDTATIGSVNMRVELGRSTTARLAGGANTAVQMRSETIISTGLDVPINNTVVLGTAMTRRSGVALILTVRPELVRVK